MSENSNHVTETKVVMSDPTALGVFGLAVVTFVGASQKLGWTTGTPYILPWAIFLGAFAQIWAATVDFKKNNYFGSIVLGVFGLFWLGVAMTWMIQLGWLGNVPKDADVRQIAFAFFAYFFFCLFIMFAAFETNKAFSALLLLILVLAFSLGMATLGVNKALFGKLAAYSEFTASIIAFYTCGAIFLNNFFGRQVLPLGKPLGLIKKGPVVSAAPQFVPAAAKR